MSLALLFPGQGTQHPQMLPWLARHPEAAVALQRLASFIGPAWRERLEDAAWLTENRNAQLLLTGIGIAAWRCIAQRVPRPAAVAGYSVGEMAAYAVAGVIDDDTALALAADRAQAMSESVRGMETGLLAIQGPGARRLVESAPGLEVAIRIDADRVIAGGKVCALDAAAAGWRAGGMRCTRLAIGVASHTSWMKPAAAAFSRRLAAVSFSAPECLVVCNFSGAASRQPALLSQALALQIANPVRWDECMDTLAERRVSCVLEVGPGTTLASMWRDRHPAIPARSVDEFREIDGVERWIRQHLAADSDRQEKRPWEPRP